MSSTPGDEETAPNQDDVGNASATSRDPETGAILNEYGDRIHAALLKGEVVLYASASHGREFFRAHKPTELVATASRSLTQWLPIVWHLLSMIELPFFFGWIIFAPFAFGWWSIAAIVASLITTVLSTPGRFFTFLRTRRAAELFAAFIVASFLVTQARQRIWCALGAIYCVIQLAIALSPWMYMARIPLERPSLISPFANLGYVRLRRKAQA